jgi:hypothetical protein
MHAAMWMARMEARLLHQEWTGVDLVITSGRRKATPGGSSLHPKGRAMDIRVWYLDSAQRQNQFAERLQGILGEDFDVIVEGPASRVEKYRDRPPHIHVEYDPKGRHARRAQ